MVEKAPLGRGVVPTQTENSSLEQKLQERREQIEQMFPNVRNKPHGGAIIQEIRLNIELSLINRCLKNN